MYVYFTYYIYIYLPLNSIEMDNQKYQAYIKPVLIVSGQNHNEKFKS